jgi:DNA-binding Lrp family transcriptional regulator
MPTSSLDYHDVKIREALSTLNKIDEIDVKILEGLALLGPRNLTLIAEHLGMPPTTVRYRVCRMLDDSILFLHLNPYHTNMGLRKAVIFVEAVLGYEDLLLDCLRVNDFWLYLCRIYGPYEGWGGIWTVPNDNVDDFKVFLKRLLDLGVAKSVEINWTTCHEGIPVKSRWFSIEENSWVFNWNEWIKEVEEIEGELPYTVKDPEDWPIRVDYTDLLIIKELEINGRATMTDISKKIGIPLETVKYHFREHVSKFDLIEGYQIDIPL